MFRLKSKKIAGDIYWLFLKWIACRCVARSNSRETPRHSFASSSRLMWKYILGVCIHRVDTVAHDIHMMKSCRRKAFYWHKHVQCSRQTDILRCSTEKTSEGSRINVKITLSTAVFFFCTDVGRKKSDEDKKTTLQTGPHNRLKHR